MTAHERNETKAEKSENGEVEMKTQPVFSFK